MFPILQREEGRIVLRIHSGRLPSKDSSRRKWLDRLPLLLFVATIASVTYSGYGHAAGYLSLLKILGRLQYDENTFMLVFVVLYTLSVLAVVGLHELGHLISSRGHKVKASLPFFIPGPPPFGTFGAVIRQEGPTLNRKELFDLGLSGPISGFIVSLIISYFGLPMSQVVSAQELALVTKTIETTSIGIPVSWIVLDSLFFSGQLFLSRPLDSGIFINPVAFAAWAGLFITFLNAFPIGQLDGGHVSFALFGQKYHKYISYGAALVMGWWFGYWAMAVLALLTLRAGNPVMLDNVTPLDTKRKIASLAIPVMLVLSSSLI